MTSTPAPATADSHPAAGAAASRAATASAEASTRALAEASSTATRGPGTRGLARHHTGDMPPRRDGWLSPIELDERDEPLTTAQRTPKVAVAAAQPIRFARARRASDRGLLAMTLKSYLELLDWTGRQLRAGSHGVFPSGLASILDRFQVSAESWLETIARFGRRFHRAVGLADHLRVEVQRLGQTRLHGLHWSQAAFGTSVRS